MSRLSINELILCPLYRCYPAPMPKPRYHTPQGLADMVRDARMRARLRAERGRWLEVRA